MFRAISANCQLAIWQAGISAQSATECRLDPLRRLQLIGDYCRANIREARARHAELNGTRPLVGRMVHYLLVSIP